jgi:predicted nucleotidyltransferase
VGAVTVLARDLSREQLIAELRALRPELQRKGVTHMALFGSRARQDNRPDSDIDLLLEIDEARKFSLLDLISVGRVIEDRIELPTSLVEREGLDARFLAEVTRDQVPVF